MQTRTKGLAPSPTRSLSKYGSISARVSPTCNLTNLYHYSQRPVYVRFPCNGSAFRRSLRCTSDTYSLHMHRMPTIKWARRSRQSSIWDTYLMKKNTLLTKTYHFRLDITAHNSENRVQVQALCEIITVAKPYDLR
jgi:hypothetical protein